MAPVLGSASGISSLFWDDISNTDFSPSLCSPLSKRPCPLYFLFFVIFFNSELIWRIKFAQRCFWNGIRNLWKTCLTAEPHKVHHKECTVRGELHTEEKHIKNRLQKHSSTIYNRNNKKYRGYLWSVNKWAPIQARTTLLFHGSCFNVFRQIRGTKKKKHTQTNNSTLLCNVTAAFPLNWDGVLWYRGQYEYKRNPHNDYNKC